MKKTIVVWHDCDPCITRSLINYLNWKYLTSNPSVETEIIYLEDLRNKKVEESILIKILRECEALIYSCRSYHNIPASKEEWELIKDKPWYAVSWAIEDQEEYKLSLSLFTIKNITFISNEGLVKLMKDVRKKRSRL